MLLGLSLSAFTTLHVVISLVAIVTGLVALADMARGTRQAGITAIFLATTVLTSVTGFMIPAAAPTPAHVVGAISLVVLLVALAGLYAFKLSGIWRMLYVITAVTALYLNVFVLIAQGFQKIPLLHQLAPTQAEPPFAVAQGVILLLFLFAGYRATKGFRTAAA